MIDMIEIWWKFSSKVPSFFQKESRKAEGVRPVSIQGRGTEKGQTHPTPSGIPGKNLTSSGL